MAKVAEDAAAELPLNDERLEEATTTAPKKQGRHIVIALRHMRIQRDKLNAQLDELVKERDSLDASIAALEKE